MAKRLLISLVVLIIVCVFIYSSYKNKELETSYNIYTGKITSYGTGSRAGVRFYYELVHGRDTIKNSRKVYIGKTQAKKFVSLQLPVIISTTDVTNNKILILREDFEQYHMAYPDSLKWIDNVTRF